MHYFSKRCVRCNIFSYLCIFQHVTAILMWYLLIQRDVCRTTNRWWELLLRYWNLVIYYMKYLRVLTLKAPRKKCIWKMMSAEVICCKYLPNIMDKFKKRSKQCGPRSSLIWIHTVCHRGFLNSSADEKSRRLVAIGALRVNLIFVVSSDHFLSFADNLCKQFVPKSAPTKCRTWSGSKLFDTLMVFLKYFLKKLILKKKKKRQRKHIKLSGIQRMLLENLSMGITFSPFWVQQCWIKMNAVYHTDT